MSKAVILVAGPSGSGKSSLIAAIKKYGVEHNNFPLYVQSLCVDDFLPLQVAQRSLRNPAGKLLQLEVLKNARQLLEKHDSPAKTGLLLFIEDVFCSRSGRRAFSLLAKQCKPPLIVYSNQQLLIDDAMFKVLLLSTPWEVCVANQQSRSLNRQVDSEEILRQIDLLRQLECSRKTRYLRASVAVTDTTNICELISSLENDVTKHRPIKTSLQHKEGDTDSEHRLRDRMEMFSRQILHQWRQKAGSSVTPEKMELALRTRNEVIKGECNLSTYTLFERHIEIAECKQMVNCLGGSMDYLEAELRNALEHVSCMPRDDARTET